MTQDNGLMSGCDACEALHKDSIAIPKELYIRLNQLGLIPNDVRSYNVGESDYAEHVIQPWSIWQDYQLDPWDADLIKRTLRNKDGESELQSLRKRRHIIDEKIRQIDVKADAPAYQYI